MSNVVNLTEQLRNTEIDRDMFERLYKQEQEDREKDRRDFESEVKRLKEASESDVKYIRQLSDENLNLATTVRNLERTLNNHFRG